MSERFLSVFEDSPLCLRTSHLCVSNSRQCVRTSCQCFTSLASFWWILIGGWILLIGVRGLLCCIWGFVISVLSFSFRSEAFVSAFETSSIRVWGFVIDACNIHISICGPVDLQCPRLSHLLVMPSCRFSWSNHCLRTFCQYLGPPCRVGNPVVDGWDIFLDSQGLGVDLWSLFSVVWGDLSRNHTHGDSGSVSPWYLGKYVTLYYTFCWVQFSADVS